MPCSNCIFQGKNCEPKPEGYGCANYVAKGSKLAEEIEYNKETTEEEND